MEGLPLLPFCSGLGRVKGQSAQDSESQQVAAIPTHNVKLTNKTGEMKKGGGKTNQNRTQPSNLLHRAGDWAGSI